MGWKGAAGGAAHMMRFYGCSSTLLFSSRMCIELMEKDGGEGQGEVQEEKNNSRRKRIKKKEESTSNSRSFRSQFLRKPTSKRNQKKKKINNASVNSSKNMNIHVNNT